MTEIEINFEARSLKTIQKLLATMVEERLPAKSFGYLLFEVYFGPDAKMGDMRCTIGTIDNPNPPCGELFEWEPSTVICCDDYVLEKKRIYVALDTKNRLVSVTTGEPVYHETTEFVRVLHRI